jgi:hypothetical protein
MGNRWCDTEGYLGGRDHYVDESSFEWIIFEGVERYWCGDCIDRSRKLMEDRSRKLIEDWEREE